MFYFGEFKLSFDVTAYNIGWVDTDFFDALIECRIHFKIFEGEIASGVDIVCIFKGYFSYDVIDVVSFNINDYFAAELGNTIVFDKVECV